MSAQPAARWPSWSELLDRQAGVLGRRQAELGGLSPGQWRARCGRDWQVPVAGVAVAHTGPLREEELMWVAVLAGGRGAALTGDWALRAAGWQVPSAGPLHVAVPTERRVRPRIVVEGRGVAEVAIHPRRVTGLTDLVHPVLSPPRVRPAPATLHAAAWAGSGRAAEWRVAAVVQQRLTTVPALRDALAAMPSLPRSGLVRRVLDDVEVGAHAQTELDLLAFLRRHRLPRPDRMQLAVRAGSLRYLDAWWERQRTVAEIDGAHHRAVAAWDADVLRANDLVVAHRDDRVLLLRFTGGNLRHDEAAVARQLRAVLS